VTGSECTGKTTLAQTLARYLDCPWSPEAAREYLARKRSALTAADVEPIARQQIAEEDLALAQADRLMVLDTDLVSTLVYARHYYGEYPQWIAQAARTRSGDLYLLCDIDLPWVADGPQRDRASPAARSAIHALFVATLDQARLSWLLVRGQGKQRTQQALAAVHQHLVESGDVDNDIPAE
jgi:NadR type nicotinamide-nucleotide adenylyltransferase|tara:strand:- start:619 stop:1161 length:543 start_codon:yes stop_codon:yes gene_type:complete